MKMRLLAIVVLLLLLPVASVFIVLGMLVQLFSGSFIVGMELADDLLKALVRKGLKKESK